MADDRKPPVHRRPKFLLVCIYLMGYAVIRLTGDVVSQTARIQVEQQSGLEYVVGPDPTIPRWRRQIYRGLFSPCMVVEEEAHKLATGDSGWIRDIGDFFRDLVGV